MLGNISIWQLVIVLAIIILLFGTKKLRNIGGDLGSSLKSFKKAISDEDPKLNADSAQRSVPADQDASFAESAQPESRSNPLPNK